MSQSKNTRSSLSDDEFPIPSHTMHPLSKMTPGEAVEYLDQKYSTRFTMDDPLFVEAMARQPTDPPIEINYIGRIRKYRNPHNQHYQRRNQY